MSDQPERRTPQVILTLSPLGELQMELPRGAIRQIIELSSSPAKAIETILRQLRFQASANAKPLGEKRSAPRWRRVSESPLVQQGGVTVRKLRAGERGRTKPKPINLSCEELGL